MLDSKLAGLMIFKFATSYGIKDEKFRRNSNTNNVP